MKSCPLKFGDAAVGQFFDAEEWEKLMYALGHITNLDLVNKVLPLADPHQQFALGVLTGMHRIYAGESTTHAVVPVKVFVENPDLPGLWVGEK